MNPHELREAFLRFFEERGHRRVPGAPLVPPGDPTLLFTSAGMVQFKPYFTGQAEPPSPRMVSVQKCFRTSDIESVGDPSHLTFFEMLGNFSVGDYFKAEAIPWAHEFLTQVLKLPPERLWPAIFQDDDEAFDLWRKQGFAAERIMRYGEEDNYWFSGDVGPCGPDSEIHYDFGEQFGCGPDCHPAHGHPRFVEIWNLVFMTYYCDGEKRGPLPKKNIDTGSGLERVMSVLLHNSPGWDKDRLPSVYDTEVFSPLIRRIEQLSGKKYGADEATDRAIRIVAEHARAVTFLIGDERTPVVPSNEERGYVCRRMLRRAIYYMLRLIKGGYSLPSDFSEDTPTIDSFFRKLRAYEAKQTARSEAFSEGQSFLLPVVDATIETMKDSYPELSRQGDFIRQAVRREEEGFHRTLISGDSLLREAMAVKEGAISVATDPIDPRREFKIFLESFRPSKVVSEVTVPQLVSDISAGVIPRRKISGPEAFLLHDTHGFPLELTVEVAEQNGFTVDLEGFEAEMAKQRNRARASAGGAESVAADALYASLVQEPTVFTGYQEIETRSPVAAIVVAGAKAQDADAGADIEVFLAATPLYPEGGGQVGDRGEIVGPNGRFDVLDTQRVAGKLIVHRGRVTEGRIAVGDEVTARVDPAHRGNTKRNHTATHLLHASLRQVIGPHVRQAGSLVAPDHLRFDFTHTEAVTPEQLAAVESLVNEKVRQDVPVHTRETSFDEAIGEGVLAFFGDKYGDRVRVVEVNTVVPRFSAELCGGTHCERTGEIGLFLINKESSIGAGMRRIEAFTGAGADEYVRRQRFQMMEVARLLEASSSDEVQDKLDTMLLARDAMQRTVGKMARHWARDVAAELLLSVQQMAGISLIVAKLDPPDSSAETMRSLADDLRSGLQGLGGGVAVVGYPSDDKPAFIALVTKDLVERGLHAGNLLKRVANITGGNAGGRPDMAQGGGKDVAKLDEALAVVPDAVREMLGG